MGLFSAKFSKHNFIFEFSLPGFGNLQIIIEMGRFEFVTIFCQTVYRQQSVLGLRWPVNPYMVFAKLWERTSTFFSHFSLISHFSLSLFFGIFSLSCYSSCLTSCLCLRFRISSVRTSFPVSCFSHCCVFSCFSSCLVFCFTFGHASCYTLVFPLTRQFASDHNYALEFFSYRLKTWISRLLASLNSLLKFFMWYMLQPRP